MLQPRDTGHRLHGRGSERDQRPRGQRTQPQHAPRRRDDQHVQGKRAAGEDHPRAKRVEARALTERVDPELDVRDGAQEEQEAERPERAGHARPRADRDVMRGGRAEREGGRREDLPRDATVELRADEQRARGRRPERHRPEREQSREPPDDEQRRERDRRRGGEPQQPAAHPSHRGRVGRRREAEPESGEELVVGEEQQDDRDQEQELRSAEPTRDAATDGPGDQQHRPGTVLAGQDLLEAHGARQTR